MTNGDIELIGEGHIRNVYLVNYKEQKLAMKILRDDYSLRQSKSRVDKLHRWEAAALTAVRTEALRDGGL